MPIDYLANRPIAVADTECYPNLWAIGFRGIADGRVKVISMREGETLDRRAIAKVFRNFRIATFNGINYDLPMIALAMSGATCAEMKRANDEIILSGLRYWEFYDRYGVSMPDFVDHIDLMEVAPSAAQRASLKKYAGMMHSKRMQELPYDPDHVLAPHEIDEVIDYCGNDLINTQDLCEEMAPQLALRAEISAEHNFDFRSKSDAQCGEAVVKLLAEKRTGKRIYKPDIKPGRFNYVAPAYIQFKTPEMQAMLSDVLRSPFTIKRDGYVLMPESLSDRDIVIGQGVYRMGIGGLHSQEKSVSHYADDEFDLSDNDVTSYYPNLMLRSGREPANLRGHFQPIFGKLVNDRIAAKKAKKKARAESLKIFVNGLFGKTGSPYSIVYAPEMMIQTTITGQLSILMLIEDVELHGFQVISANTDGFVTKVPKDRRWLFRAIVFEWECASGLDTEETFYRSVHSRDVNNYVALAYENGKEGTIKPKRKGAYAPSGRGIPGGFGLKKTPDMEICSDAAVEFLLNGTAIERTVRNCQDIRKFVVVRRVTGGAEKDNVPIGKNVRFYFSTNDPGPLRYITNGNKVPDSDGAAPCMELPDELPGDIDYERYEREAYAILDDMGVAVPDPTLRGRTGFVLGHREDQKTLHKIDASTGIALCGAARPDRRSLWVEHQAVPDGMRYCAKCRRSEEL